jgi:hypothetical protein
MAIRRKHKSKSSSFITAVQLDLDTKGIAYNKWGSRQVCKRGDWLVDNNGDKYTVEEESFARTYSFVSPGVYTKSTPVWAEVADKPGRIRTKEGETAYRAGDYLVSNNQDGTDAYAISAEKFQALYDIDNE